MGKGRGERDSQRDRWTKERLTYTQTDTHRETAREKESTETKSHS